MRSTFFALLLILMACAGCGPSLTRIGYEQPSDSIREDCRVTFIEPAQNKEIPGKLLGTLKVGDTGFSMNCDEKVARSLIRDEACRIGADIVVLKDVQKPSFTSSSCYRVTADLIQSSDTLGLKTHMALQQKASAPSYPPKMTLYGTFGYGAAAMNQLNESIEHNEAVFRAAGYPIDLQTFDAGGLEFGVGFTVRSHRLFSLGLDLNFQSMNVESQYADANLEYSDKIETSIIDVQVRGEYWLPAVTGLNFGGFVGVPFGEYHEVNSFALQDPPNSGYSDVSFWSVDFSCGAFVGYELPFGSRGVMLTRLGYRYRILGDQLSTIKIVDSQGQNIETDFSGFYVMAALGFRVKTPQQVAN